MGLLKLFKKHDEQKEDPEWKEVMEFREEQMKKILIEEGIIDESVESVEGKEKEEKKPESKPPDTISTEGPPSTDFHCTQCNLKFKESWNKCPKCGGDVAPVRTDTTSSVTPLASRRTGGIKQRPISRGEGTPSGNTGVRKVRPVKTVKRKPGATMKTANTVKSSTNRKVEPIGNSRFSSNEIDNLFDEDPLIDGSGSQHHEPIPHEKASWKGTSAMKKSITYTHTPPPEIKSMLHDLTDDAPLSSRKFQVKQTCPKCGFTNPPGSWEFCMKCGHHLT